MTLGLLFLFLFLLSAAPHPPSPDSGQQHGSLFRDKAHTIDGTDINIDTHQMSERRTCQAPLEHLCLVQPIFCKDSANECRTCQAPLEHLCRVQPIFCKDSTNECRICQACLSIYAECSLSSAKIRNKTIATSVLPLFLFFFRISMVCMILHTCHALPAAQHQHMTTAGGISPVIFSLFSL